MPASRCSPRPGPAVAPDTSAAPQVRSGGREATSDPRSRPGPLPSAGFADASGSFWDASADLADASGNFPLCVCRPCRRLRELPTRVCRPCRRLRELPTRVCRPCRRLRELPLASAGSADASKTFPDASADSAIGSFGPPRRPAERPAPRRHKHVVQRTHARFAVPAESRTGMSCIMPARRSTGPEIASLRGDARLAPCLHCGCS
jgi:hypothetical protein